MHGSLLRNCQRYPQVHRLVLLALHHQHLSSLSPLRLYGHSALHVQSSHVWHIYLYIIYMSPSIHIHAPWVIYMPYPQPSQATPPPSGDTQKDTQKAHGILTAEQLRAQELINIEKNKNHELEMWKLRRWSSKRVVVRLKLNVLRKKEKTKCRKQADWKTCWPKHSIGWMIWKMQWRRKKKRNNRRKKLQ